MRQPTMPESNTPYESGQHDAADTPSEDFASESVTPAAQEKSPGVYTRATEQSPRELDMLWSSSRSTYHREERSPVIFFVAGFLLATIVTSAFFMLISKKPDIKMGEMAFVDKSTSVEKVAAETSVASEAAVEHAETKATSADSTNIEPESNVKLVTEEQPKTEEKKTPFGLPNLASFLPKPKPKSTEDSDVVVKTESTGSKESTRTAVTTGTTHTVVSGDTLERIARKYYGSGKPSNVEKLQRANNMKSPDALQIDQKLVIPPQTY